MTKAEKYVKVRLFEMQDLEYKAFHSKLMPTVDPDLVIGVRTPQLKKFAKEFAKTDMAEDFLNTLPHKFYEENNLHAFLISLLKDYNEVTARLDTFLPYVDNWATCDMMRPTVFKKHLPELLSKIGEWMKSGETYTIRFGIEMLMIYFLDEYFKPEYPEAVAEVRSDEYYVKMMVAWYFATALAKQYEAVLPFIENKVLEPWTHNKAIQKSVESYRITDGQKEYLKTLKIKNPALK
ncbi:MAG: DNA alkylation repair protein [Clostridia bacterium]|nr:DNA alkylation repair protein [Clostridia bacterium]